MYFFKEKIYINERITENMKERNQVYTNSYNVVKLVGGGSVMNGAPPSSFLTVTALHCTV